MRMRKKKWARPELAAAAFFVDEPTQLLGRWGESFEKKQPVYLELGCGKSPFLAEMGLLHQDINFIGIDQSADVLGVARRNISAAYEAAGKEVGNVLLCAWHIERLPEIMNENDRIARIYINFCNPWQKKKHHKRRLTYPLFLKMYKPLLEEGGEIWFKTDDSGLFEDSLGYFEREHFELLRKTYDLHAEENWPENVMTEHEMMFSAQGIPIKAAIFRKGGLD